MVKTILKLVLLTIIHSLVFMIGNAVMPFSQEFKELGSSGNPLSLLFLLINSGWTCFTLFFIIHHTFYRGRILFFKLLFILFFVQCFMTQIETLFFGNAFPVLTKIDILLIMAASFIPLLAVIPLAIKLFVKNKKSLNENSKIAKQLFVIKNLLIKFGIIGIIYLFIYMIFGYFVAWQFEELRIFYSGSPEKLPFFTHIKDLVINNPVIYPFQIIRGILFAVFIFPLINMLNKNKTIFIISICLVYLSTAIMLIIPNVLFPDIVRYGHLLEMTSSMLLFGIVVGNVLWRLRVL